MAVAGQDRCVSFPLIGVNHSTLAIHTGHRFPQPPCRIPRAVADIAPDNLTGCDIQRQPDPLLVALMIDERPQLIHLDGKFPFAFGLHLHRLRHCLIVTVDISLQPVLGQLHHTSNPR